MTERREFRRFIVELSLMLLFSGIATAAAVAAAGKALRMAGWV